ncbi:MAG: TlpA disulfide reductase family protein [Candidatus Nanopelagicales bacterium]|jgi:thiol-disulfide isomerase/thioredoxin
MRSLPRLTLTVALVFSLGLTACSTAPSTDAGFVSGDGSITIVEPDQRLLAPNATGVDLDGAPLELADFAGQVVVLNVWASWCAPCRAEAGALEEVAVQFAGQGVQFLGLNTRDSNAAAQAFIRNYGVTYPSFVDSDGRIQLLFNDSLPPQAIPSTIVIDQQGRVAARALGVVTAPTLRAMIEPLLVESGNPDG